MVKKTNINTSLFELDEKTKKVLNTKMLLALFKIIYDQNKITQKEYDAIISSVNRILN